MKDEEKISEREKWADNTTEAILAGRNHSRKDGIMAHCIKCSLESLDNCCGDKTSKLFPKYKGCSLFPFRKGGGGAKLNITDEQRKVIGKRLLQSKNRHKT